MDKFFDALHVDKFNGSDSEGLLFWFICIVAMLQEKAIHIVVQRIEEQPPEENVTAHSEYAEKVSLESAITVIAFGRWSDDSYSDYSESKWNVGQT